MSSDNNDSRELPEGWELCTSKSNPGKRYYFHRKTGKSSWSKPQADDNGSDKQKNKNDKTFSREKKKKEELHRKNLKRKSDGACQQTSPKKKFKEKSNTSQIESPNKCDVNRHATSTPNNTQTLRKSEGARINSFADLDESPIIPSRKRSLDNTTPIKQTPTKNLANARLAQLRAQLNSEIQKEEESKELSPPNKKKKVSPVETETSRGKTEKSPNSNESKCLTQSPTGESLHSIPSSSQFFAANKIISSMKAHLSEEYCEKTKQKDTFADIEQGICNQVMEYPYVKHPATPPQFSEASKLVSAIKSKLSSKLTCKDNTNTFSSAKERMDSLRNSMTGNIMDTTLEDSGVSNKSVEYTNEAMDVDFKEQQSPIAKFHSPFITIQQSQVSLYDGLPIINPMGSNVTDFIIHNVEYNSEPMDLDFEEVKKAVPLVNCTRSNTDGSNDNVVLTVDTNIFIHELDVIKSVLDSRIKGYSEQPTLIIPWRVVNELDRLKDNNNGKGAIICKRAKSAMDYLYKSLPKNDRIKGQTLRDANSHIYPCEMPDDEILNCCLQQLDKGKSVILLSNDKNLCTKARINNVKCIGLEELKGLLESKPQPQHDPDLIAGLKHCETAMYQLLSNILESEMRAIYQNLWHHVLFKVPPWTLGDVLQCLLKHWMAVFSEVFPRIEHLITELKNAFFAIERKDPQTISQSEVTNFKELCLDIARKCQIIPDYMELAKATVEKLERKHDAESAGDRDLIDAFEGLWTVYSSYCAKLATCLGISHSLEDKLPSDDHLETLMTKLDVFEGNIKDLAYAMQRALSIEDACDQSLEECVTQLESAFNASMEAINTKSEIARTNLRVFCTKSRNLLQEASAKFTQLAELLEVCKNSITSK